MAKKRGLNLPSQRTFKGNAAIWKRAVAFVVDLLIIDFVVGSAFNNLVRDAIPKETSNIYLFLVNNPQALKLLSAIAIATAILGVLYFSILELKLKQTIGKMLMKIYIVSELKELSYWQCIVRSIFLVPVFPIIILWVIDPLFMVFTKDNKRLSEILSKTRTVEEFVME